MLETHGLKYISTPRPKNSKGKTYGGAAIVVNTEKFNCEKLSVFVPENLEVVWGLVKPKTPSAIFKSIIACSFYSPPNKNKNSKMADHVVSTLHMLCSKYPDSRSRYESDGYPPNLRLWSEVTPDSEQKYKKE